MLIIFIFLYTYISKEMNKYFLWDIDLFNFCNDFKISEFKIEKNLKIMTGWYIGGLNMSNEGWSRFICNQMTFEESLKVTGFIIRISVRNII